MVFTGKSLRKNSDLELNYAGAKAQANQAFSAQLKLCPDTNRLRIGVIAIVASLQSVHRSRGRLRSINILAGLPHSLL